MNIDKKLLDELKSLSVEEVPKNYANINELCQITPYATTQLRQHLNGGKFKSIDRVDIKQGNNWVRYYDVKQILSLWKKKNESGNIR